MAIVNGTPGNDFIHRAGDGLVVPPGFTEVTGATNGADTLSGFDGNDTLIGGGGADVLDGGDAFDLAGYQDAPAGVIANLANPAVNTGDAAGDAYILIEGLIGSNFNDTLTGDANNNILRGGAGADALDGGAGFDYADYDTAVTASLANPAVNTGEAAGDTYVSIEGLLGSVFNDTLIGDAGNNELRGGTGADVLDGGGGFDFAGYQNAGAGVTASLANPAMNTGDAAGDTYFSIEGLRGSDFNDTLIGDANGNALEGGAGADVLNGGAGDDTLTGGAGVDTFVFAPGFNADTVTDFSSADGDRVDLSDFTNIQTFAQVQALATQVGPDTVINFGNGDTLTLAGVALGGLASSNFLLSLNQVTFGPPNLALGIFGTNATAGGWVSQDLYPRLLGDVNGDGRADVVGFGSAGAFTALGQADGTFATPVTASSIFGASPAAGGWASQNVFPRLLGDVNGDGRADIVGFGVAGAFTALGQGNGTFATPITASSIFGTSAAAGGWVGEDLYPRLLGDVNGDGRADIVGFGEAGAFTALGQANGTFAAPNLALNGLGASTAAGGWVSDNLYPRLLGDTNGDGRADIVGFGEAGAFTALGQADGTFAAPFLSLNGLGASVSAGGWVSDDVYPRTLGDVNGDGNADIIAFGEAGAFTALGRGDGTFAAPVLGLDNFGRSAAAGGWSTGNTFPRFAADVNGDNLDDLVGFGAAGVYVAQSHLV